MKKVDMTINDTVKEAIAVATYQLMIKKPCNKISIREISEKAGVSRSSFYRNFSSKEEVLLYYIQREYKTYFVRELEENCIDDKRIFMKKRFEFIKIHSDFFLALYKNNLIEYIFENLDMNLSRLLSDGQSVLSPYHRAAFSSSSSGVIKCWIGRNFQDSEEELLRIFESLSVDHVMKQM